MIKLEDTAVIMVFASVPTACTATVPAAKKPAIKNVQIIFFIFVLGSVNFCQQL
jgi:hypothetical protein